MISALNRLVGLVEKHLTEELDVNGLARALGTTEYHLRRMFSSLAGMPLPALVTCAATEALFARNRSSGSA